MKKSSLVCVDLYKNVIYDYSNHFNPKVKYKVKNNEFSICFIPAKALTTLKYYTDEKENLGIKIIKFAYDELLLNPQKEYKISYFDDSDGGYMLYIIDIELALKELDTQAINILKNINIIIPSPLLMGGFYSSNLLDKSSIDCFIFYDNDESYLCFYRNGRYVMHHGIICDTLPKIARNYKIECTAKIIDQNSNKFTELLNITIQTIQSIANIDKIIPDRIYLSSFIGDIIGLNTALSNKLGQEVRGFEFLDNFKSPAPLNLMMAIYAKELIHKGQLLNFTLFNKPKPLYKRADGRLFISIAAGAILGLIYPIYMLILTFNIEAKSTKLGANLTLQNSSVSSLNSSLIALNNEIKSITIQIQNIKNNINKNLATIDIIASKFNNQNLAIILANIANLMDKYSLQARNIELKNNQINIAIISQDTQNINNFINSFSTKTHIGQLISNQNIFESNLTIEQENGF